MSASTSRPSLGHPNGKIDPDRSELARVDIGDDASQRGYTLDKTCQLPPNHRRRLLTVE